MNDVTGVKVKSISGSVAPAMVRFQVKKVLVAASNINVPCTLMGPPGPEAGKPGWKVAFCRAQVIGAAFEKARPAVKNRIEVRRARRKRFKIRNSSDDIEDDSSIKEWMGLPTLRSFMPRVRK
jgi:hypothetical protein